MLGIVPQNRHRIAYWEILFDCFHSTMVQVECRLQKKGGVVFHLVSQLSQFYGQPASTQGRLQ